MNIKVAIARTMPYVEKTKLPDSHPEYGKDHLYDMLHQMLQWPLWDQKTNEKANRWLGWVQACIVMGGGATLEEMKDANRTEDISYDLVNHLYRQKTFSEKTFGPGMRTEGVCDHIRKELHEIQQKPDDLEEWIDVILLAFDGAWRSGGTPEQIVQMLQTKQTKNENRKWPDWRLSHPGKAIEHIRD